jgi:hypothetical protein
MHIFVLNAKAIVYAPPQAAELEAAGYVRPD